jgi:hypothetical protein
MNHEILQGIQILTSRFRPSAHIGDALPFGKTNELNYTEKKGGSKKLKN